MVRALTLLAIICICGLVITPTEARRRKTTTTTTTTTSTTTPAPTTVALDESDSSSLEDPEDVYDDEESAEDVKTKVLEQLDRRLPDGNFEYKYILSNGVARHEKSYWIPVGDSKLLARKGYYSYPLTDDKYITVHYTADEHGYHQDSSTISKQVPELPRTLDVPVYEFPPVTASSTTSTTTRKPRPTRTTRKSQATTKASKKQNDNEN